MPAKVNGAAYPHYTLITHVRYLDPVARAAEDRDILLVRESESAPLRLLQIGNSLKPPADAPVTRIRGLGLHACRSFVDLHFHICEPGAMYKEDIRTALTAAASGGYGDLLAIPSPDVRWNESETVDYIASNAKGRLQMGIAPPLTKGGKGKEQADFDDLIAHGATAFYDDGIASPALLYTAMVELARRGALLILRPHLPLQAPNAPLKSARAAEAAAVSAALAMAELTGCRLHLTVISTALSVELIRAAKARGVAVTCDTAPQYFTLTRSDLLYYGNLAKVEPPLCDRSDREAIIAGLADGTIDCIVSDHTPEESKDKKKPVTEAPAGMIGIQTVFALGMRELVLTGKLDLYRLIALISENPARILGLPPTLQEGAEAKITLLDLSRTYTLTTTMLDSKVKTCPWVGQAFQGSIKRTVM